MYDLDPVTGLPKLEENLFWRVSRDHTYHLFRYQYVDNSTDDNSTDDVLPTGPNVKLMSISPTVRTEIPEKTFLDRILFRTPDPIQVPYEDREKMVSIEFIRDDAGKYVNYLKIKPEFILQACESILERRRLAVESNKYFGDYPPKKLEQG